MRKFVFSTQSLNQLDSLRVIKLHYCPQTVSFAFIYVPPPPALLIASRAGWVTATNTLTRYGSLEPRRELRSAARATSSGLDCATRSRPCPAGRPETGGFQRAHRAPAPSLVVSWCVWESWISSPSKGKLIGRSSSSTRLPCHSSDVTKSGAFPVKQ